MMPKVMWRPSSSLQDKSQMMHFLHLINETYDLKLADYADLYNWSIKNKDHFWERIWYFCSIKSSKLADTIFIPSDSMQHAKWFKDAELNFAENLLRRRDNKPAIIFNNEKNQRRTFSFSELHQAVAKVAEYFRNIGLQKNDRVAAVLPNMPETIISMLATASIGAIWSSCSPDFGEEGLFDRLHQIQPKILITCDGYFYNGKIFAMEEKIKWLCDKVTSIEKIILVPYAKVDFSLETMDFYTLLSQPDTVLNFEQLPFDHPIYIMFSSGTTGVPKCIVHGAGGTLIQHLKELSLHTNITKKDTIFYYTTCGWMMWNWYISSLALGATVVQYDGAPLYPHPLKLFELIEQEKITVFGTSAKYISALEKNNAHPKSNHNLRSLKTILSTGSPLVASNYDFVYQHIKSNICLSSISGGTDIISCFALGNPILPVYRGELQCVGLGMNVKIYNENGQSVVNEKGELVCIDSFPSMPVYFWNDPKGEKYTEAYFNKFPNTWTHGDYAEITDRHTVIIYGRSDATLNPSGIRIGTAEIYRQIEKFSEIVDSLAVSQDWKDDNRIILFIILKEGQKLNANLESKIKNMIREHCSPHHVPAKIVAVADIPRTLSGKIVELAVREIIHNRPVKNISALANPESLKHFQNLKELDS